MKRVLSNLTQCSTLKKFNHKSVKDTLYINTKEVYSVSGNLQFHLFHLSTKIADLPFKPVKIMLI